VDDRKDQYNPHADMMDEPRNLQAIEQGHEKIEYLERRSHRGIDRIEGEAGGEHQQINHDNEEVSRGRKRVVARVIVGIVTDEGIIQESSPQAAPAPA
jgi:hypothetical protein